MRVLVVEDNREARAELVRGLSDQGIDADAVGMGRAALDVFGHVDAVLLDLVLPDIDGFEVCRAIRTTSDVPIIIVSGRGDEFDRVLGLRMGADDYVVKPFGVRELAARIQAVVRRAGGRARPGAVPAAAQGVHGTHAARAVHEVGAIRLDVHRRQLTVKGRLVTLTRKEFDLLAYLATDPGRTFTREQIMTGVWGHDGAGDTRTLGVHMAGLRRKIGASDVIETVRGVGFRLAA